MSKITPSKNEAPDQFMPEDAINTSFLNERIELAEIVIDKFNRDLTDIGLIAKDLGEETLNRVSKTYNTVEKDIASFTVKINNLKVDVKKFKEDDFFGGISLLNEIQIVLTEMESTIIPNLLEIYDVLKKSGDKNVG